jgi:hypothetical protein
MGSSRDFLFPPVPRPSRSAHPASHPMGISFPQAVKLPSHVYLMTTTMCVQTYLVHLTPIRLQRESYETKSVTLLIVKEGGAYTYN